MYQLLVSVLNILDLVKCIMFCHKVAECYYVTVSVLYCPKITYIILYLLSVDFLQFINILYIYMHVLLL